MANHMECYVKVENLTQEGADLLRKILEPAGGDSQVYTDELLERLYGATEEQFEEREYRIDNIGAKWVAANLEYLEDGEAEISSTSAWSVPYQMYLRLVELLVEVSPDVLLTGTYEDEGYDPCGAFIIANNYDDIEDVFGTDDIDYDKLWDDDDYRDSISDELNKEVSYMRSAYFEYLQEIKEENS